MKKISRDDAVHLIVNLMLPKISYELRESYIFETFCLDEDDSELSYFSGELKKEIISHEAPLNDIDSKKYDPIVLVALSFEYVGVTNEYINSELSKHSSEEVVVTGQVELLHACPCCNYRTIINRGNYEICKICKWEDTGEICLDKYSSANKITLREAKARFQKNYSKLFPEKYLFAN
jgi:hypothetical protein